jgi:DNA-binding NtrC family response regulator
MSLTIINEETIVMARLKQKASSTGKRILLIDDQKDYLESTIKLLEREGHDATGVSSADEMLYAAKRSKDKNTSIMEVDWIPFD